MFIVEDPGQLKDIRVKEVQQSYVRSYTSSWAHQKRKRSKSQPIYAQAEAGSILSGDGESSSNALLLEDKTGSYNDEDNSHHPRIEISGPANSKITTFNTVNPTVLKPRVTDIWTAMHNQYRAQISPSLNYISPHHLGTASSATENRALQFFRERTAIHWSGWQDAMFWSVLALQTSNMVPGLRHALIALASRHEHLETEDPARRRFLWEFGLSQGWQALTYLNRDYTKMSISAILTTHIVLSSYTAILDTGIYSRVLKNQNDFVDRLRDDYGSRLTSAEDMYHIANYLEPLVQRKRSQDAHHLDLAWNLAHAPISSFWHIREVQVPTAFTDLKHARDVLEDILVSITFDAKFKKYPTNYLHTAATTLLIDWHRNVQLLSQNSPLSVLDQYSLALLRVCAKVNVVIIQTMNTDDEMAFDEHIEAYRELVTVGQQYVTLQSSGKASLTRFGMDSGFITLLGNAAVRWCREPTIRRQLIELLYSSNRWEGFESAAVWARICERVQLIEETGLQSQPQHDCTDHPVPAESRIRLVEVPFYYGRQLCRIRYARSPWKEGDLQDSYIHHDNDVRLYHGRSASAAHGLLQWEPEELPDLRVGRDYFSWLDISTNEYNTTQSSRFYFPLPRV